MSARVSFLEINLANKPEKSYERKLDKDTRELRVTVKPGEYKVEDIDLSLPRGIQATYYVNDDGAKIFTVKLPRRRRKAILALVSGAGSGHSSLPSISIPIAIKADPPSPKGTILPL